MLNHMISFSWKDIESHVITVNERSIGCPTNECWILMITSLSSSYALSLMNYYWEVFILTDIPWHINERLFQYLMLYAFPVNSLSMSYRFITRQYVQGFFIPGHRLTLGQLMTGKSSWFLKKVLKVTLLRGKEDIDGEWNHTLSHFWILSSWKC